MPTKRDHSAASSHVKDVAEAATRPDTKTCTFGREVKCRIASRSIL